MSRPVDELYEQIPVEVIDDMTQVAKTMGETDPGAMKLMLYVLLKRGAKRIEKSRGPVTPAKGVKRG